MNQYVHNSIDNLIKTPTNYSNCNHAITITKKQKLSDLCSDVITIVCTFLDRKDLMNISKVIRYLYSDEFKDVWIEASLRDSITCLDKILIPNIKTSIRRVIMSNKCKVQSMDIYINTQNLIDEYKTQLIFNQQHSSIDIASLEGQLNSHVNIYGDPRLITLTQLIEGTFETYIYKLNTLNDMCVIMDMVKITKYVVRTMININTDASAKILALIYKTYKSHDNKHMSETVIKAMTEELTVYPDHLKKIIYHLSEINKLIKSTRRDSYEAITNDRLDKKVRETKTNTINYKSTFAAKNNQKSKNRIFFSQKKKRI